MPDDIIPRLQALSDGGIDTVLLIDPNGEQRSLEIFASEIAPRIDVRTASPAPIL
jgi:hypothetical protein